MISFGVKRFIPASVKKGFGWRINKNKAADKTVQHVIDIVRKRTKRGIDVDGNAFAPYSNVYKKRLERARRSTKVNLMLSGNMMKSMHEVSRQVSKTEVTVVIGPDNAFSPTISLSRRGRGKRSRVRKVSNAELGNIHDIGAGNVPERHWLGLSDNERMQLIRKIRKIAGLVRRART